MPEEDSKWAFVSDYRIGLLPHHDSLLMSKESQIRAHKEELNQRSSVLTLTHFFYVFGDGQMSLTIVNKTCASSYLSECVLPFNKNVM